jgi:hypothetical protein
MRNNPLPVIVPCHRVIASSGKLHGFGGTCDGSSRALEVKEALLRMEGAMDLGLWISDTGLGPQATPANARNRPKSTIQNPKTRIPSAPGAVSR